MKLHCITVVEPFASLIRLPASDHRAKRVENRPIRPKWAKGDLASRPVPLLIHAGRAEEYRGRSVAELSRRYGMETAERMRGHVIAVAEVIAVTPGDSVGRLSGSLAWVNEHPHAEPESRWCWVLGRVAPLPPMEARGLQGVWMADYPAELLPAWAVEAAETVKAVA